MKELRHKCLSFLNVFLALQILYLIQISFAYAIGPSHYSEETIKYLKFNNKPLNQVLKEVSWLTGYSFVINREYADMKVSGTLTNVDLHRGLKEIVGKRSHTITYEPNRTVSLNIYKSSPPAPYIQNLSAVAAPATYRISSSRPLRNPHRRFIDKARIKNAAVESYQQDEYQTELNSQYDDDSFDNEVYENEALYEDRDYQDQDYNDEDSGSNRGSFRKIVKKSSDQNQINTLDTNSDQYDENEVYQDGAYQDDAYQDDSYQDDAYQDDAYQDDAYQDDAYQDDAYQDQEQYQEELYDEEYNEYNEYEDQYYEDQRSSSNRRSFRKMLRVSEQNRRNLSETYEDDERYNQYQDYYEYDNQ